MKFLGTLFESKKAAGGGKGVIARATGGSKAGASNSYTVPHKWDIDTAVQDGYERVLWVYRCVDAVAQAQSSVPIIVRRGDLYDGEIVEYDDINRLLNFRPNSYEDAWSFRYRLSSIAQLSPRGVFIEMVPSRGGGVAELHLIPPGSCEPIPDTEKFVSGFKVTRADYTEEVLDPKRVIWIKTKPHPTDPYLQMTPLVAAGLAVETDYFARVFNRNFLANDGRPGMLISISGQLGTEDAQEIKRRFGGGYTQAGQTTVIESDGIDVADLAANPRDIQWSELLSGSKSDILLAFGTPESVLGNASGRTYDNADAEKEVFYLETVVPHGNAITRGLDALTGNTEDRDCPVHDWSKVEILQRAEQKRRDLAAVRFAQGLTTMDEYFEEIGKKPLNIPASRVYFHPNGIVIGQSEEDVQKVAALPRVGEPAPPDASENARRGALQGAAEGQRNFENIIAARAASLAGKAHRPSRFRKGHPDSGSTSTPDATHPYAEVRAGLEGAIEGALTYWTNRQMSVVGDRLLHTKVRKGTRHWIGDGQESNTKALNASYVVELDKWVDDVRETLTSILQKAAMKEANRVARDMRATGVTDLLNADGIGNPSARGAVTRIMSLDELQTLVDATIGPVLDNVSDAAKRQSQRIIDTIREMDASGASIEDIQNALGKMLSPRSKWHRSLAITTTTATIESVRNSMYGKAGAYIEKTWEGIEDAKVRPSHRRAIGQRRKVGSPFTVGGIRMDHPCDPKAPIHETANCRCWVNYKISSSAVRRRNTRQGVKP